MNQLTKFLVDGILNEAESDVITALFAGGFKPPTKGHLEVILKAIRENPEIDQIYIVVGSGVRNGISQSQSIKIWEKYKKFIPKPTEIIESGSPIAWVKDYLKDHTEDKTYVLIGAREGDIGDEKDVEQRSNLFQKYGGEIKPIYTVGGISGTKARQAAKQSKEAFYQFLPDQLSNSDKEEIYNIIIPTLNEVGEGSSKPYKWEKDFDEYVFTTDSNVRYIVSLEEMPEGDKMGISVEFLAKTPEMDGYSSKIEVGRGELFRVMATIIDIIKSHLSKDPEIEFILYSPSKKAGEGDIGNQRDKLYKIFLQKQIPGIRIRDIGTSAVIAYLPQKSELNENASYSSDIDYKSLIKELTKYMIKDGWNILPLPKVVFKHGDSENARDFFGKTAYYDPNTKTIVLYTEGRHPKDIVRSFSHEMVHHEQNLDGRLGDIQTTNTQEDDYLNDIEAEANLNGTMTFRNWTDSLNEGPQFGVLYHYTEFLLNILDDNILRGPISLTRSRDSFVKDWLGSIPILVLDKDKLRTKYKIRPYQDYDDAERSEDEMEEVIDTNVTNLSKYIIKVILPKPNEKYEDALKEKGIPYEIDKPLNEKKKPYKHKHGFDDKLGKDPFGLNAYARELALGLEEEIEEGRKKKKDPKTGIGKKLDIPGGLEEGKQVGLLYHFTSTNSLDKILKDNKINGSFMYEVGDKELYGVSTTRNKNLNYDLQRNNVRITLDGNKLSNNYKITPRDYFERQYNIPDNPQTIDEDEEVILTPKGYINNIKNYILAVDKVEDLKESRKKKKDPKKGTGKKSVTIDMGPILKALEFKMPTGQETDENVIAIIDAAPRGTVPHPVFLDFYAKFDKYFGEENDSRMLDNFGLEYLLSKVLNLSNEDIQTVINHYNTTDQDSVEWFEQHDNELEKKEEWNVDGFDPTQDNLATVNQYLSKNKKLHESDPKKGTGKKPKGSDRRLYTDEDPKDTVGIKFRTKEDIVDTLNKKSFKAKSHARQSQIINLIHQRVRAAYQNAKDAETKARLKRGLDYIEKRKETSKKKTQRLKKQKLKENQMSMEDFNLVGAVLRDKNKAEEIHNLLLQMFPKQKELLNYNYKNDSYAEFKRFIFYIDKYKLEGPISINHTDLKLDPQVMKDRERKYQEYIDGKIDRYFRDSDSDPRTLDLSKMPPITVDSTGEVMDGNHRAFLAIKQQKPLKGYKIVDANNTHPNVEKILQIIGKKQKLKESTKSDFNRVLYYQNYFTNLSPSTFDINIVEDDIMISGINKPYPPEFNDTTDTRQVPVNQNLEENIDPKSQKKHKGKSAPFGSAYEPVDEGDTYEKMAAKGKKAGNLKQGTVRKRLGIPKDKKIPLSLINKEIARLKKMDKDPDKKGVQLGDKNQKYYKALQLAKTLKTTTNLNEGRYDTLANKLSSIAFKAFKDIHDRGDKEGSFKFRVDHPDDEHDIPSEEFYFDFEGVVEITDDEYNVDGGANAGFDTKGNEVTPLLSVEFKIPKNPDWQEVSFNIKDVVRHELEHLTQDGENEKGGAWHEDPKLRRPSKYMEDDQLIRNLIDAKLLPKSQYFKLEKEIDAMLQGLYFKAKKSKRPFKDVINTYLNIFLDQETITQEEKNDILKIWRNRAKSLSLPLFESKSISDLYTVYLDMDGVIADFDKRFTELAGMGPREYESSFGREKFWDFIDNKIGVKFWTGIEWMPEGKKLYNFVKQFDHKLLSAPSRNDTSKIGKRMWAKKNTPGTQLILAAAVNKQNYADKSNILIDDREKNIQQWKDAGGIGILFKSTDQVIDELKKIMNL